MEEINKNKLEDEIQCAPSQKEMMYCKRAFVRKFAFVPDIDEEWKAFSKKNISVHHSSRRLIVGIVSGIAASVLLVIGSWLYFDYSGRQKSVTLFQATHSEEGIILSSATGTRYDLSKMMAGTVLQGGVKADKDSLVYLSGNVDQQPREMTLSTPRGKDYHITLPDGTKAYLNAESKLIFPDRFVGPKREVVLEGEGYFEVSKDKAHPFVVRNRTFSTMALGTKFVVNAYPQSAANVVLIEGKVAVRSSYGNKEKILLPGQKAVFSKSGITVSTVDTYASTQWKEGYFYFNNVSLSDILQEVGRWYNVDIVVENQRAMHLRLHFVAERNLGITQTIENLNSIGDFHALFSDNKLIIR